MKPSSVKHWLLKSEPGTFSIDDLAARPGGVTAWDGVRNYQARNTLRDSMKKGDTAFFYHSSCPVPGIAGIVDIVRAGYPDPTAFDPQHDHYDADSRGDAPRWYVVDVRLRRKFVNLVTLDELRRHARDELSEFVILKKGNRLSVTPVSSEEWNFILTLE